MMKKSPTNSHYDDNFERKRAFEKEILLNRVKNSAYIFESARARQVIEHTKEHYGDELEFLWIDTPNAAVLRHKENKKWYAIMMVINARKLGLSDDENISIMNVKAKPKFIDELVDDTRFFRAYHMNKKHWLTIKLDESVDFKAVCELIDESWHITRKK